MMQTTRGFTLVELMIAVAVAAVLLLIAVPSFYDFILVQRLKGINAELVTDMQLSRSEAVSRGRNVRIQFATPAGGAAMSCYTAYIDTSANPIGKCDCTKAPGERCPQATSTELRTVQIPTSSGIKLSLPPAQETNFAFIATHGSMRFGLVDEAARVEPFQIIAAIDATRRLRTEVHRSGRPSVCSPGGGVSGVLPC